MRIVVYFSLYSVYKSFFERKYNMILTKEKTARSLVDFCNGLQKTKTIIKWDSTVERCARTAEMFRSILEQPEFAKSPEVAGMQKRLEALVDRCVNSEFQIAFVGTIKAGKSTLINAILGQNVASTRVTPETAVLTKFRNSHYDYIKVKFYSKNEWDELWKTISNRADTFLAEYKHLNGENHKSKWVGHSEYNKSINRSNLKEELEIWSSSKHVEHYFVKEIEIGLSSLNLPENVVFVDTPGLDDPVKYRSDVTRNYINRANAVFVCVTAHSMTGEETKNIYSVFSNSSSPEKIFVIGTQADNLNKPEKEWKEQKNEWIKYLEEKAAFNNRQLAESNIICTAGYIENLCREYLNDSNSFNDDDVDLLVSFAMKYGIITMGDMIKGKVSNNMNEYVEKLRERSNISVLLDKIRNDILAKYRQFLIDDIIKIYTSLKQDIVKFFKEINDENKKLLDASNGNVDEIRKQYEIAYENSQAQKQVKEALSVLLNDLKENNSKRIKDLELKLKNVSDC